MLGESGSLLSAKFVVITLSLKKPFCRYLISLFAPVQAVSACYGGVGGFSVCPEVKRFSRRLCSYAHLMLTVQCTPPSASVKSALMKDAVCLNYVTADWR